MIALMALTSSSSGLGARPTLLRGLAMGALRLAARLDRETPSASQTAVIGYRPWAARARARDVFFGRSRAPEPLSGSRLPSSSCRAGAASREAGFTSLDNPTPEPPLPLTPPPSARPAHPPRASSPP